MEKFVTGLKTFEDVVSNCLREMSCTQFCDVRSKDNLRDSLWSMLIRQPYLLVERDSARAEPTVEPSSVIFLTTNKGVRCGIFFRGSGIRVSLYNGDSELGEFSFFTYEELRLDVRSFESRLIEIMLSMIVFKFGRQDKFTLPATKSG